MGILRTTIGVESHRHRGDIRELPDTLVDTGSEYSWIPRDVLESLGIEVERAQRFRTADGRVVHRVTGYAIIHAGGTRTSDEVVFAEPGDMVLLGAHTIEGLNLRVDLKTRQLVSAGPVPAALFLVPGSAVDQVPDLFASGVVHRDAAGPFQRHWSFVGASARSWRSSI